MKQGAFVRAKDPNGWLGPQAWKAVSEVKEGHWLVVSADGTVTDAWDDEVEDAEPWEER